MKFQQSDVFHHQSLVLFRTDDSHWYGLIHQAGRPNGFSDRVRSCGPFGIFGSDRSDQSPGESCRVVVVGGIGWKPPSRARSVWSIKSSVVDAEWLPCQLARRLRSPSLNLHVGQSSGRDNRQHVLKCVRRYDFKHCIGNVVRAVQSIIVSMSVQREVV